MKTKIVEVQDLMRGDMLASGGTVTHSPTAGLHTPNGKVDLGIDGIGRTWNKKTKIAILCQKVAQDSGDQSV